MRGWFERVKSRSFLHRSPSGFFAALGWIFIAIAGFFLTYQLFFTAIPLERLSRVTGGEPQDLRYDGVVYFSGYAINPGEVLRLNYVLPWIVKWGRPDLEIFLQRAPRTGDKNPKAGANLLISGDGFPKARTLKLSVDQLQRFTVPWKPKPLRQQTLDFTFDGPQGERLVLATNIVRFNVWPAVLVGFGFGAALLILSIRSSQAFWPYRAKQVAVVTAIIVIGYWAQSGAFISNDFFSGHGKIAASTSHLGSIVETGHLKQTTYRQVGAVLIPIFAVTLEGAKSITLQGSFRDHYPASRYLAFLITIWGISWLSLKLMRHFGVALGATFGLLAVTFFPFIVDLYSPDVDAYFVMLFPFLMVCMIGMLYESERFNVYFAGTAFLLFLYGTIKVTPIFLVLLVPFCIALAETIPFIKRLLRFAVRTAIFLLAFQIGIWSDQAFVHPNRNVGIEGIKFRDNMVWGILWAAYGLYDDNSAHKFTKSGGQRNERFSKALGLPKVTYLRHSQIVSDKIYKPEVLNALKERPGFFYATALHRFYEAGLKFYRYSYGPQDLWMPWITETRQSAKLIDGKEVPARSHEVQAIRFGKGWKVAPLVLLAKFTQGDITRLFDIVLLIAAFTGMFIFRNNGLRAFLILLALAQIGFDSGIHAVNRYFMFCSYALLLGLAAFAVRFAALIYLLPNPPPRHCRQMTS